LIFWDSLIVCVRFKHWGSGCSRWCEQLFDASYSNGFVLVSRYVRMTSSIKFKRWIPSTTIRGQKMICKMLMHVLTRRLIWSVSPNWCCKAKWSVSIYTSKDQAMFTY
jgi:hypothetical protein